ncbi:MAG: deoxyribonuclease IV [Armatimonadota bacterium]|nr:deoxyribonuclease IV [Armatimonadota bacterium]
MRLGAHVSVGGKIYKAVERAVKIGCECLQIFVGNPRQWRLVPYPEEDLEAFRRLREEAGLDPLVAHTPYLVNLASPHPSYSRNSIAATIFCMQTMERLGGLGVVTHIGSRKGASWPEAKGRVLRAIRQILEATSTTLLLLENSAGSGDHLGATFEELREIFEGLGWHPRVGICLDSAHLFAAGWDLSTPKGVEAMLEAFDETVGLDRLKLFHLNDSRAPLGSHRDRHENIGEGEIGLMGFLAIVRHPKLEGIAGIIETPGFNQTGPDRKNLSILKQLREGSLGREGGRRARGLASPLCSKGTHEALWPRDSHRTSPKGL